MRQRGIRNKDRIYAECAPWMVSGPERFKGGWRRLFARPQAPLHLEIGSGKGKFICEMAALHPEVNFLAAEGAVNVNIRILQKAKESNLSNLLVIMSYIDDAEDIFAEGELDRIYLNFSDPWPKAGHAKRRLTHRDRLRAYMHAAAPGAVLRFKTDNDGLFDFSLEEIRSSGMLLQWVTRDLHRSPYGLGNVQTEYESRFREAGKSINGLQALLKRKQHGDN